MALPSSPPLPCEEIPSSPPLLPTLNSISIAGNASRKRLHSDYGSLSSDPLFSEDVSELDFQDEEEQPRRKRMVRGPWWTVGRKPSLNLRKSMVKKEGFRNTDSGVFMGSDDSFDSLSSDRIRPESVSREDTVRQREQPDFKEDDPQAFAEKVVQGCLENGKEMIDLSGLNLTHISNTTLFPLHQMIRHAHDDMTQPPSEDLFAPLTPSIQLYLYGNLLDSLPPELFHLTNITVLSLRNNSFQEISPAIARLHKLTELNLAGNQLKYLPWEIMEMLKSTEDACKVNLRPNPFRVPPLDHHDNLLDSDDTRPDQNAAQSSLSAQLEARFLLGRRTLNGGDEDATPKKKRSNREQLIFLAPSRIKFIDSNGSVVRQLPPRGPSAEACWEAPFLEAQHPPSAYASATAPSLFELALRSSQIWYDLRDATFVLPQDTPTNVFRALESAARGFEYGNDRCTTCTKPFLIPRAEWLEYWFQGHDYYDLSEDRMLPFKRKACSWACAKPTEVGTAFA